MSAEALQAPVQGVGESPIKHALKRLSVYLIRNWRYYLVWFVAVVFYTVIFNAIPMMVGRTVDGLIDPAVDADTVIADHV